MSLSSSCAPATLGTPSDDVLEPSCFDPAGEVVVSCSLALGLLHRPRRHTAGAIEIQPSVSLFLQVWKRMTRSGIEPHSQRSGKTLENRVARLFLEQVFTYARQADLLADGTQQKHLNEKTSHKGMPIDELVEHGANVKEASAGTVLINPLESWSWHSC
jgi:hypothetical protein